jgi:hypothetical protein
MHNPPHQALDTQPLGVAAWRLDEMQKSFHRRLLEEAKTRHASGQSELAVVFTQAAVELCTEWAITALFSSRRDHDLAEPILDLFQVKDICNDRVRAIYCALSNDHPEKASFWSDLTVHRNRRHSIVHRGENCAPRRC